MPESDVSRELLAAAVAPEFAFDFAFVAAAYFCFLGGRF
jgi:hypothetical protein